MRYYNLNAMLQTMQYPLIEEAKVTSIVKLDWNDMEGQNYKINVRLITADGYKNKMVSILTNSTYLDEWDDKEQGLLDYVSDLLNGQKKLLRTA